MNQVLTQDEINALLRGLSDGDIEGDTLEGGHEGVRKYDLASQDRIIRGRMPTMELIHDRFARAFRTSLSKFLGKTCFINVGGIEIVKFGLFMKKLPLPSSLHIYRMPPLQGQALMVVSTPLVFGIVDSLFGGKGSGKVRIEGREYTPIESRLVGKIVSMALEHLKEAWTPVHTVDFQFVRSEFNPLAIAIVPPTDVVVIVTVEVELEHESTTLVFCTPYATIEPIRHKLSAGFQTNRLEVDHALFERLEASVKKTSVELRVELAHGKITTREALVLKAGDVLPLATATADDAIIRVEGIPKYTGSVGAYRGSRAVQITAAITKEDE